MQREVKIMDADIQGAGTGNDNDPLARALNRVSGKSWRTEVYSHGVELGMGGAWTNDFSENFTIDPVTTRALVAMDSGVPFQSCAAILTEAI